MPNPRPKPPKIVNLASLARVHTEECIRTLAGYARDSNIARVPPAVRIQAIGMLLDRGWGRAPQTHTGADGVGDIRVTIRHIVESVGANGQIVDVSPYTPALEAPDDEEVRR